MWKYEPKISFLRVACGSSVGDHSKSVLDTLAPIILSAVIRVVAVVNWRWQGPSSWSRGLQNRLVSATRCRTQTGVPQNYFYYAIDWSREKRHGVAATKKKRRDLARRVRMTESLTSTPLTVPVPVAHLRTTAVVCCLLGGRWWLFRSLRTVHRVPTANVSLRIPLSVAIVIVFLLFLQQSWGVNHYRCRFTNPRL